jgi:hypothetical protein
MFKRGLNIVCLTALMIIGIANAVTASQFRGGTVSYRINHSIPNCVTFTIESSHFIYAPPLDTLIYQVSKSKDGPFSSGRPRVGNWINMAYILPFQAYQGTNPSNPPIYIPVVSQITWCDSTGAGNEGKYFLTTSTFDFVYPSSWSSCFSVSIKSSAWISALQEHNNDLSYQVITTVYPLLCDSSPTTYIDPSLRFTQSKINTFKVPVEPLPGYTTKFALVPTTESLLTRCRPCGTTMCTDQTYNTASGTCGDPMLNPNSRCLKLDPNTGLITWNPGIVGDYAISFKVSWWNSQGVLAGAIPIDMLIAVRSSWPVFAPTIQSIFPSSGINNGRVQITNLAGANFRSGATVCLRKAGQTDIPATDAAVFSSHRITCAFDITNACGGKWDVIVANDDAKSDTLTGGFTIVSQPPLLVAPATNQTNVSLTPGLVWRKAAFDSMYQAQVSTSSSFGTTIVSYANLTDTAITLSPAALGTGTLYFWRVASIKKGGEVTAYSSIWSFTTVPSIPSQPRLLTPVTASPDVSLTPLLTWAASTGATQYRLQVSTDLTFASAPALDDSTVITTSYVTPALETHTGYFWRVSAANAGGTSPWSDIWQFITIPNVPGAVQLVSPLANDTVQADSVTLVWRDIETKGDRFLVDYGTDSTFAVSSSDSMLTDTVKILRSLGNHSVIFWRVKAHNAAGWGEFSSMGRFVVEWSTTRLKESAAPREFALFLTADHAIINYTLAKPVSVTLQVYDFRGRRLYAVTKARQEAGRYSVTLSNNSVRTGVYIVTLQAGEFRKNGKMVVKR